MSNNLAFFSSKSPYLGWRLASIVVVGVMTLATIGSLWFIYKNIYSTIQDSTVIVLLSVSTSWQTVDLPTFQKIEVRLREKNTPQEWPVPLRNLFSYQEAGPALPTSTPSR